MQETRVMVSRALVIVSCTLVIVTQPTAAFLSDRPRVHCESGHLRLDAGAGKNISLRTQGSGAVVINGVDVAGSLTLVAAVRPQLEGLHNTDLGFLVRNLSQVARTVASFNWVSTSIAFLNDTVASSTRTTTALRGEVTSIRTTLRDRLDPLVANVSRLSQQVALVTPDGGQHLQNINDVLTRLQQEATQRQQAIRNLEERTVPRIQESVAHLQGAVASLPEVQNRLQALESQVNTNDSTTDDSNTSRSVRRDIRKLKRDVNQLKSRLLLDECESGPCRNGGTCIDGFQKFHCLCPSGWKGGNCDEDVNECYELQGTESGCQNGASCRNIPGDFRCVCRPGFYGIHCELTSNNCTAATGTELCGAHGICIPSARGRFPYSCICDEGWKSGNDTPACVDVDECRSTSRPHCSTNPLVQCVNYPGGFTCGPCPQGYSGDGFVCSDVNECDINNGGCSPYSICYNTVGGRRCGPCAAGYTGDGVTCYQAPSPCQRSPCHYLARCFDDPRISPTYVQCICPSGYQGQGFGFHGCTLISSPSGGSEVQPVTNWCAVSQCMNGGTCVQSPSTYTCICTPGYTGRNCEVDFDECSSSPCLHGGTCTQGINSYTCSCPSSHTGDRCQTENERCGGLISGTGGVIAYPGAQGVFYNHNISCAWRLIVPRGKVINITFNNFHLEGGRGGCRFDWLQIHDGRDSQERMIGRFCGTRLPGTNGTIVSTHNYLYLWFRSDHSRAGYGFNFTWNATDPVCGADIRGQEHGSINSPGYPGRYPTNRDCYWTIQVRPGNRIEFHFATLQIEQHSNCSYDFLEVRDGLTESDHSLGKYCYTQTPAPLTTSGAEAFIHFHSDPSLTDTGFHITFNSEPGSPGCGGLLTNDMGEFSAPTISDAYEHNLHCEWVIRVPPGETIRLNFSDFHLENHRACRWDYLAIRDGGSEDSPEISRSCGVNIPLPVLSTGNQLHVTFHSDHSISGRGFTASYQVACGGEYGGTTGLIRSPYHPRAYPHNRECIYVINTPPRTAIVLNFTEFDIEGPSFFSGCVYDYVEIRDGSRASSPLLGRYCGPASHAPEPVRSQLNHMWLKFRTDASVTNMGFVANFTTIDIRCGEVMRALSGVINSPNSPERYPGSTDCYWVLDLPEGYVIQLTWSSFSLSGSRSCNNDYVEVFDNSSIPGMGGRMGPRYCGQQTPPLKTSSSNLVTIHFHSDYDVNNDGFSLIYHGLNASRMCGGHYHTNAGMITSPNYPFNYPNSRNCEWTITAAIRTQIRLTFEEVEIEGAENCRYDALEIRNGRYSTSPLIRKICSRNQTVPEVISHSHQLYLKFTSDYSRTFKGFKLFWDTASTGCGGTLTAVSGEIISPGYPEPYHHNADCYWTIRVAQGSAVKLHFADLDIEQTPNCYFDFVEVRDGSTPQSPLLGRYCSGNQVFVSINSSSNALWIRFRSDYSESGRGFKAQYMTECNRVLRGHRGVITTPGYPDPYPHNRNCTWTIQAPAGNSINASFSEFVLEDHMDPESGQCFYDFVEIYEGQQRTGVRSQIGHYCQNVPPPVATASQMNVLEINFVSDYSVANNGFRLEWIVNGCGGEMTRPSGSFTSPNYPNAYPINTDCEWFIRTAPGTKIQITIHEFDLESSGTCYFDVLQVYGGKDTTSPVLTTVCHEQSRPTTVTTQGNTALLTFHSDQSVRGKGFRASYVTLLDGCGGLFTAVQGSIHSPKYPELYDVHSDCEWTIRVDPLHVVELNFTDFDIEPSANCTFDYLTVYDGEGEEAPQLMQHCGSTLPNPTLVRSSTNVMTIRFKADGSSSGRGFKADYFAGCGASVEVGVEELGELVSPHYPSLYTFALNCSWHLHAPAGYRLMLHVVHLDMHTRAPSNDNCTFQYLAILDGGQLDSPERGRYCGNRAPRSIVSSSEYMTVTLINEYAYVSFRAVYSVLTSRCGGDLTSMSGEVASPNYPEPYPDNTDCEWSISAGSGNRVELNFIEFDIEESAGCNLDYVEVHERTAAGPLLLHNCSSSNSQIPAAVIARDALWIKFHSDESGVGARGFLADYSLLHGSNLYGTSGEVVSPLYPHTYMGRDDITWTITVPRYKFVSITLLDMAIEGSPVVDECFASLVIYDGRSVRGGRLLGTFCGYQVPSAPIVSTRRTVAVRLNAQHRHEGSKFRFRYEAVDTRGTPGQTRLGDESNNCSFVMTLNETYNVFHNPGYPGYTNNLNCEWIIQALPHKRILMDIFVELEESASCYYDRLEVYDGLEGTTNWNLTHTLCRRDQSPAHVASSGRFLRMRFITDSSITRQGFTSYVVAVCGGYVGGAEGVIATTNYPENYPADRNCLWIIKVGVGRTIRLEFEDFRVANTTPTCGGAYLSIRNGAHSTSPFVGAGKFCGRSIPQGLESSSNVLRLNFVVSGIINTDKGFKLRYYEQASTCGGNHRLDVDIPKQTIQSPNFPNPPNHNTECSWTILAPPEKAISLHFVDPFDITSIYDNCDQAFVEVRDGGTLISPLLGKFCGSHSPDTQHTTSNAIYIRYYNNVSEPHSGFKAEATIDRCGGTYNAWEDGIISSPGFPTPYSADLNCTYKVVAPYGHSVNLQFLDVDIFSLSQNCTGPWGRLQIREKNATGDELGTLCSSGEEVAPINTFSNIAYISFVGGPNPANRKGFRIMYNKSLDECGGEVAGPEGEIRSPGYPHGYSRGRTCEWVITVPRGKRVRLDFIDLDLGSLLSPPEVPHARFRYCADYIMIQNGPLDTSPLLTNPICTTPIENGEWGINSSMNTMRVRLKTYGHNLGRGFRARWSSDDPQECGGELLSPNGELTSPGHHVGTYNNSLNCVWTVTNPNPSNASFFVTFTYIHLEGHCFDHVVIEGVSVTGEAELVKNVCNDFDRSVIVVPYATLRISFVTDRTVNASGWNLTYGLADCGGVVHGPQSVLTSPNYPAHYPNNVHCAWSLNYDEGEQIEFEFTSFRLENSMNHDYVVVYNGPRITSPMLGHYTGRKEPFSVGPSMTNNLLVAFHTDGSTTDGGFRAVATRHVTGCGGVFHGLAGNFSSHGFPGQYEANLECEWEVDITTGYHAIITFTDRFDIETSPACQNDYIQIFSSMETNPHAPVRWVGGEKMCGKQLPPPVNSSGSSIKLLFHTNDAVQGDGFKVSWQQVCGNIYTGSVGYIVSPQHPNNYPDNALCVYRIVAPREKYITINFLSFDLESGPSCLFDNLTVIQERPSFLRRWQTTRSWGPYCGGNPPPAAITTRGPTTLVFASDFTYTKAGFVANFTVEGCGGNISAPGVIQLPTRPIYAPHMSCTWYITAPEGKVPHFKFQELEIEGSYRCQYDSLSIYDGHAIRNDKMVVRLCGNHMGAMPVVVGRERLARLVFRSDRSISGEGFRAALEFTYHCGGNVNISYNGASETIRSLDADNDGNYEPMLYCGWLVEGLADHVVTLTFSRLDVEPPGANDTSPCPYDAVKVYDGPSEASALITTRCNSTELPGPISSSSNVMFIRFYSDSTNQYPGFTAMLTNTPHPCGASSLEATNETQVLESPGYPTAYPISTRCQWVITAPEDDMDIHLEINDFSLEASPRCSKDQLYISEYDRADPGRIPINNARTRPYEVALNFNGRRAYFILDNRLSHGYCGSTFSHHLTSTTNAVRLAFVSDEATVAPGFRLHYSIAGCNRTFNSTSGRVTSAGGRSSCFSTFLAPPGSFINLYFNNFYTVSPNCSNDDSLKVYDGADATAPLLLSACEFALPGPVYSTGNALRLEFKRAHSGYFDLAYSTSTQGGGCGGSMYAYRWTTMTSPSYPGPAPGGLDCVYALSVNPSHNLVFRIMYLDFGSSEGCNSTFLELYDVSLSGEPSLFNTLCGHEDTSRHLAQSNKMILRYVTGSGNVTGQGWSVNFFPAHHVVNDESSAEASP
ncbi:cubilin [Procambarus clarkii]|uniref:cubilin n=1 Tax=Procambarus clarkii TaxID=6728 RepID=UPI001E674F19|nr:cubilin-like [Procambarus clarkii]XP_045623433.1 cubilin-like [Procambarus clarkii]